MMLNVVCSGFEKCIRNEMYWTKRRKIERQKENVKSICSVKRIECVKGKNIILFEPHHCWLKIECWMRYADTEHWTHMKRGYISLWFVFVNHNMCSVTPYLCRTVQLYNARILQKRIEATRPFYFIIIVVSFFFDCNYIYNNMQW